MKKMSDLMKISEFIIKKIGFITILNKMLSDKMRIKNYYDKR